MAEGSFGNFVAMLGWSMWGAWTRRASSSYIVVGWLEASTITSTTFIPFKHGARHWQFGSCPQKNRIVVGHVEDLMFVLCIIVLVLFVIKTIPTITICIRKYQCNVKKLDVKCVYFCMFYSLLCFQFTQLSSCFTLRNIADNLVTKKLPNHNNLYHVYCFVIQKVWISGSTLTRIIIRKKTCTAVPPVIRYLDENCSTICGIIIRLMCAWACRFL